MKSRFSSALVLLMLSAPPSADGDAAAPDASARSFTAALDARIAGKAPLDDVRVDAFWSAGGKSSMARIWGDGVGVWDRSVQFSLPRRDVIAVLEILKKADFPNMRSSTAAAVPTPALEAPPSLVGRIVLTIGPVAKEVIQLFGNDPSPEIQRTAVAILDVCRPAAAKGARAASLDEGLRMVADGRLAAEALLVLAQRGAARGAPEPGWTLRLEGRTVTARAMPAGKAPPPARRLTLTESELRALAVRISESGFAGLPINVYSADYADLKVGVLDQTHDVAGRKFGNLTPETHGAKQKAFDGVYEAVAALAARAQKDGVQIEERRVAEPADPVDRKAATPGKAAPSPTPVRPASPGAR